MTQIPPQGSKARLLLEPSETAINTALLPQYAGSAAFMERFLVAAHAEGSLIERSANKPGIKLVDGSELDADLLSYFVENQNTLRSEFVSDLSTKISSTVIQVFCDVISNDWFDGKRLRNEGRSRRLKRSVYDYLNQVMGANCNVTVQNNDVPTDVDPLLSPGEVAAILTVNSQMLYCHIEEWKSRHPNNGILGGNPVYLRRGLALDRPLDTSESYCEWDLLNSYSIAFSAPEKFAQMTKGKLPAIVNGELELFRDRTLFFSPFIPGMDVGQLEFGIIPSERSLPLRYQGNHGGILEYIIDPPPI